MATQEEKDKLHNLTGKNVSDTYGSLLQKTDENRIVDGGGNAPSTLVFGGDIIVSGSITAESSTYIVSESILHQSTLEGSTKFGDTEDDTHQFTGTMFVTGDIIPNTANSQNIGSITKPFKSLYISSQSLNIVSGSESATLSFDSGSLTTNTAMSASTFAGESFTGNLVGTASMAELAESASFATTALSAALALAATNTYPTMSVSGSNTLIADSGSDVLSISGSEYGIKITSTDIDDNDSITFELQDTIKVPGNLYVGNNLIGSSNDSYWVENGSNISFTAGRVGIGTVDDSGKQLTVDGNISASDDIFLGGDIWTEQGNYLRDTEGAGKLGWPLSHTFMIYSHSIARVIMTADGFGLGNGNPTEILTVEGNISSSGTVYATDLNLSGNTGFVINSQTGSFASGSDVTTLQSDVNTLEANISDYMLSSETSSMDYLKVLDNGVIVGDLSVGGTVTAQEFKTEYVTSATIYQSGSTAFGDTLDDKHDFTGSVGISGSLSIDGVLNGGNLSGTNTGDQDLSSYIQNSQTSSFASGSDVTTLQTNISNYLLSSATMSIDEIVVDGDVSASGDFYVGDDIYFNKDGVTYHSITQGGAGLVINSGSTPVITSHNHTSPKVTIHGDVYSGTDKLQKEILWNQEVTQTSSPAIPQTWTLSYTPIDNSENIFFNGLRLAPGVSYDYTISTNVVTFNNEIIFRKGDVLTIQYNHYPT